MFMIFTYWFMKILFSGFNWILAPPYSFDVWPDGLCMGLTQPQLGLGLGNYLKKGVKFFQEVGWIFPILTKYYMCMSHWWTGWHIDRLRKTWRNKKIFDGNEMKFLLLGFMNLKQGTNWVSWILLQQDWVAFMSQPYWVEVELTLILRLRFKWGWDDVESKFSWNWVGVELRKGSFELRKKLGLWFKICFRSTHIAKQHMFSMSPSILAFNFI